jgi:hypothetical protein
MANHFGQFNKDAEEKFNELAAEKYDFTTCQRSDGSKYGSPGRCIKGSETSPASKDDKKGSSKKSSGGATLDKASRAEYGKQAKTERQAAKDIQREIKSGGSTPALEKKLKQTEARAEKFERMSKTGVFESPKKSGGQDGPKPAPKQRKAAVQNFQRTINELEGKIDDGEKLTKAEQQKLSLARGAMKEYSK